jgi:hypothetical protein
VLRDPPLTFADVMLFGLSCWEPTEFFGSFSAA